MTSYRLLGATCCESRRADGGRHLPRWRGHPGQAEQVAQELELACPWPRCRWSRSGARCCSARLSQPSRVLAICRHRRRPLPRKSAWRSVPASAVSARPTSSPSSSRASASRRSSTASCLIRPWRPMCRTSSSPSSSWTLRNARFALPTSAASASPFASTTGLCGPCPDVRKKACDDCAGRRAWQGITPWQCASGWSCPVFQKACRQWLR